MDPHAAGLLLLTCLAGFSTSETGEGGAKEVSPYGPVILKIDGDSVVTVEILYSFLCTAQCNPKCTYTWTSGNMTTQGPELNLKLQHRMPTETLTCSAYNPKTGESASVQKTLQVADGPSKLRIIGPTYLTAGVTSNFSCFGSCYPSCDYTWTVTWDGELLHTQHGETLSLSPYSSTVVSETLSCEAKNTISHLYVSTALSVPVASISGISIQGDSTVTMGLTYSFICIVECVPSCKFAWKYMGRTYVGDQIEIPILYEGETRRFSSQFQVTLMDYMNSEPLTCVATNSKSDVNLTSTMDLTVINLISVRALPQAVPVAGKAFSLQCVGSQNGASITWLKNKQPLLASGRVHFTPDNVTVIFGPLLQADDGSYQCVVTEVGGRPIQSVDYIMQVNYGPTSVFITGPEALEIGVTARFFCSAECSPSCSFKWTMYGQTMAGSGLDITVNRHVAKESISCQAENTFTGKTATVNETLAVSDPHWCGC